MNRSAEDLHWYTVRNCLQRTAVPARIFIIQLCYGISFIFSNYWTYCYVKQKDELLLPFGHFISFLLNTLTCTRGFTTSAFNFSGISELLFSHLPELLDSCSHHSPCSTVVFKILVRPWLKQKTPKAKKASMFPDITDAGRPLEDYIGSKLLQYTSLWVKLTLLRK